MCSTHLNKGVSFLTTLTSTVSLCFSSISLHSTSLLPHRASLSSPLCSQLLLVSSPVNTRWRRGEERRIMFRGAQREVKNRLRRWQQKHVLSGKCKKIRLYMSYKNITAGWVLFGLNDPPPHEKKGLWLARLDYTGVEFIWNNIATALVFLLLSPLPSGQSWLDVVIEVLVCVSQLSSSVSPLLFFTL